MSVPACAFQAELAHLYPDGDNQHLLLLLRPNHLGVFVCKPVKIEHGCCFMFLCKDVPEFEQGVTGVCIVLPLKVMVRFYLFLLLSRVC